MKQFSTYVSKITLTDQTLIIEGRRYLTSLLLTAFLITCLWIMITVKLHYIFIFCIILATSILIWGMLDVIFSVNYFYFDRKQDYIEIRRKNLKHKFIYRGAGRKHLKITAVRMIASEDYDRFYNIIISFKNDDVKIAFLLSNRGVRENNVTDLLKEWQNQLQLPIEEPDFTT